MIARFLALIMIIITQQLVNSSQIGENFKAVDHSTQTEETYTDLPSSLHSISIFSGANFVEDEMRTSTFKRHKSSLKGRHDIQFHGKSNVGKQHEIIIAVFQSNLDQLEEIVLDISDPDSVNFGAVRTRDEIIAITNHRDSCNIITRFLKRIWRDNILEVKVEESNFGEFIKGILNLFMKCVKTIVISIVS